MARIASGSSFEGVDDLGEDAQVVAREVEGFRPAQSEIGRQVDDLVRPALHRQAEMGGERLGIARQRPGRTIRVAPSGIGRGDG